MEPPLGRITRWAIEIKDCRGDGRQDRERRMRRNSVRVGGQGSRELVGRDPVS